MDNERNCIVQQRVKTIPVNGEIQKVLMNHLKLVGLVAFALTSFLQVSHACLDRGVVNNFKFSKDIATFSLASGRSYQVIGNKHPLLPMLKLSAATQTEVCLTNAYENYPIQLVANFRNFSSPADENANCVKKGFVRTIYVNPKYDWFHLENGFSIRVIHRSKLTPQLYQAAFSKREVCITEMNLEATDGSWGIPREVEFPSRSSE